MVYGADQKQAKNCESLGNERSSGKIVEIYFKDVGEKKVEARNSMDETITSASHGQGWKNN